MSKKYDKIDIEFKDIDYSAKRYFFYRKKVNILKKISGHFHSNELTAIIGPSGGGKTTLLNILAGFTSKEVEGTIYDNKQLRNAEAFKKKCCYIMQDQKLQPLLTVDESMTFAASLKLSQKLSLKEKQEKINDILNSLELTDSKSTLVKNLSGGERKRLSIALDVIQNPPVMFFDEPTSGLDSLGSRNMITLLQNLAHEGRTIICSIHQPSATLLEKFDFLYCLVDGKCTYQGPVNHLLPYLQQFNPPLICPNYHNPADFLLEVCKGEYGDYFDVLIERCKNGAVARTTKEKYKISNGICNNSENLEEEKVNLISCKNFRDNEEISIKHLASQDEISANTITADARQVDQKTSIEVNSKEGSERKRKYSRITQDMFMEGLQGMLEESEEQILEAKQSCIVKDDSEKLLKERQEILETALLKNELKKKEENVDENLVNLSQEVIKLDEIYATSFFYQVLILMRRCYKIISRDSQLTYTRMALHFITSIFTGILYFNVGNDARFTIDNFSFVFFTVMFNMYVSFSSMIVAFADELPIVIKEHFNRWYSIKSYYVAVTLVDFPIQFTATLMYLLISFSMSGQKWELFRFCLFLGICYSVALVGQSFGMLISACFKLSNGIMVGPVATMPFIAFCGYFVHMKDVHPYMHWLFHISYMKYGIEGSVHALMGFNRGKLNCSVDYCHFKYPQIFMDSIGMPEPRMLLNFAVILGYYVFVKTVTYFVLWQRIGGKK